MERLRTAAVPLMADMATEPVLGVGLAGGLWSRPRTSFRAGSTARSAAARTPGTVGVPGP